MLALCDAGCGKTFETNGFQLAKLEKGVEKTYFTCTHCHREYVSFYTDAEIRRLQKEMMVRARQNGKTLKLDQIKKKMDALRERVEGGSA